MGEGDRKRHRGGICHFCSERETPKCVNGVRVQAVGLVQVVGLGVARATHATLLSKRKGEKTKQCSFLRSLTRTNTFMYVAEEELICINCYSTSVVAHARAALGCREGRALLMRGTVKYAVLDVRGGLPLSALHLL